MAITLTGGERQKFAGTFQKLATYTQSTSTTPQALDITADVHALGMGTATSQPAARNLYTLADGVEGQDVWIYSLATGEASVIMTQPSGRMQFQVSLVGLGGAATAVDTAAASATGQYVFTAAGDYLGARFLNGGWVVYALSGATFATTT